MDCVVFFFFSPEQCLCDCVRRVRLCVTRAFAYFGTLRKRLLAVKETSSAQRTWRYGVINTLAETFGRLQRHGPSHKTCLNLHSCRDVSRHLVPLAVSRSVFTHTTNTTGCGRCTTVQRTLTSVARAKESAALADSPSPGEGSASFTPTPGRWM